ncbi:hypothetical protein SKAU_G00302820 [Synaphobranchus kaupii]|uniref:Uncharacterized protein n=1 Tax=Synaphobranchus kaupii TaxID=118154 RepID=A0A9Q1EVZ9_SYNKA|nr:hypothetical protein SKAU_G00302820 [Synaphobranchus kaupii]
MHEAAVSRSRAKPQRNIQRRKPISRPLAVGRRSRNAGVKRGRVCGGGPAICHPLPADNAVPVKYRGDPLSEAHYGRDTKRNETNSHVSLATVICGETFSQNVGVVAYAAGSRSRSRDHSTARGSA